MRVLEYEPAGPDIMISTDICGDPELAKRFLDFSAQHDATPVSAGDSLGRGGIDPSTTTQLLSEASRLGGVATLGHHEWDLTNALYAVERLGSDEAKRAMTPKQKRILVEMGKSCGLKHFGNLGVLVTGLRVMLGGELEEMEARPGYHETPSAVIIHAGPRTDTPWNRQRDEIDTIIEGRQQSKEPAPGPEQIIDPDRELSGPRPVPLEIDGRIFITGHKPRRIPTEERTAERRVHLGSAKGELRLFETSTGTIHTISRKPKTQIVVSQDMLQLA